MMGNYGNGKGNHSMRLRALTSLERGGFIDFEQYNGTPEAGYRVLTPGGERTLTSKEVAPYAAGAVDGYAYAGQKVLEALDAVLPDSPEADALVAHVMELFSRDRAAHLVAAAEEFAIAYSPTLAA